MNDVAVEATGLWIERALPVWQPWASLIVNGFKRVETRHWPLPEKLWGEPIGIHATKTRDHLHLLAESPFDAYFSVDDLEDLAQVSEQLPLGAIIGYVRFSRCAQMTEQTIAALEETKPDEHAFGDYRPGRYAWVIAESHRFEEPAPWKGQQGMFRVRRYEPWPKAIET